MSIIYCENCQNFIDLDNDVEHEEMCLEADRLLEEKNKKKGKHETSKRN